MNKFRTLLENSVNRFTSGGFLTGDLVKFKSNAISSEWAKKQPENLAEKLREFVDTDMNIRISAVKSLRPAVSGSIGQQVGSDDFYCDIVREHAPGCWHDFITVPSELLEYSDPGINLPPIPDSIRRDNEEQAEPKGIEKVEETPNTPYKQTTVDGESNTLPDSNTVLDYADAGKDNFNTKVYLQGLR